ncbi:MAG: PorT family protein [Candidatus Marinimicrobia bacterium]|nr:PorT family protein [Candidatus Neomarinimicrobiota bacterium]
MKKLTVVLLAVLMTAFLATNVSAQGITGKGVKVGLNLANVAGDDVEDANSKIGFAVGGYLTYEINEKLSIQPEVMFSQKGYKIEEKLDFFGVTMSMKGTIGLNYLDVNPLVVYSLNENLRVLAGPSFGLFLNGKSKIELDIDGESEEEEEDIESDDLNGMDFGLIIGAGYNLGIVEVEARYSLGLKNAYDEDIDMKNNVFQIVVGYSF